MKTHFTRRTSYVVAIFLAWVAIGDQAVLAQAGAPYSSVVNPYLLLIRDPVVQSELGIAVEKKLAIRQVTDGLDQPLLALRGLPAQESVRTLERLIASAKAKLGKILTDREQRRLDEIVLRVQGIRALQLPAVVSRLAFSDSQQNEIHSVISNTDKAYQTARVQAQKDEDQSDFNQTTTRLYEDEQLKILAILDNAQRRKWLELLGQDFDTSRLGEMAFLAPELSESTVWINSSPRTMESLRGKVVALHFWAFG